MLPPLVHEIVILCLELAAVVAIAWWPAKD